MFSGWSEKLLFNAIGFQICWWLAILYGDAASLVLLLFLITHLLLHRDAKNELRLIVVVALIGFGVDFLLTFFKLFIFPVSSVMPPIWLFLLWLCFATTLRQCFKFLFNKTIFSALLGAAGGSISYLAAAKFDAVQLGYSWLNSLIILLFIWALLFPLFIWLANQRTKQHETA